jgi:hypothetical protein
MRTLEIDIDGNSNVSEAFIRAGVTRRFLACNVTDLHCIFSTCIFFFPSCNVFLLPLPNY